MIKAQVGQLLQKEMDRKDFLRHIGVAAAVVVGVPTLIGAISRLQNGSTSPLGDGQGSGYGYGTSAYGGNKTN